MLNILYCGVEEALLLCGNTLLQCGRSFAVVLKYSVAVWNRLHCCVEDALLLRRRLFYSGVLTFLCRHSSERGEISRSEHAQDESIYFLRPFSWEAALTCFLSHSPSPPPELTPLVIYCLAASSCWGHDQVLLPFFHIDFYMEWSKAYESELVWLLIWEHIAC